MWHTCVCVCVWEGGKGRVVNFWGWGPIPFDLEVRANRKGRPSNSVSESFYIGGDFGGEGGHI